MAFNSYQWTNLAVCAICNFNRLCLPFYIWLTESPWKDMGNILKRPLLFLRYLNVSISILLAIFPADCCWRIRSEDKPLIYDVITCLDRNLNTCTAGNLGKQIRSDTETWKFIENSCRRYASEDSSTPFLSFGIVTINGKIVSKHTSNLGTDI